MAMRALEIASAEIVDELPRLMNQLEDLTDDTDWHLLQLAPMGLTATRTRR